MAARVKSILLRNEATPELLGFRGRIFVIYGILIFANVSAWVWAFIAFAHQPVLIGTAVLAYSLGLRHAIDADHIAAIDNVTRKMMQEGKRPVAVGFFFALGHSTVVVLASLAVALTANALSDSLVSYRQSWHLYPLGLLFALGFETASEISLFGLSAQASNAVSSWPLLIFPVLFAAGMTLVDTTDGVLMLGAYGWAYRNPMRKLFYNLTITSVSVLVALLVGGVETLGLIADQFHLRGAFWNAISDLNDNFGALGYGIVALFIVSWGISLLVYRLRRYDLYARLD